MPKTYTAAILDVSATAFREIQTKLETAGYVHVFYEDQDGQLVMDMHGVALRDEDGDEGPAFDALLLCQRRAHDRAGRPS